jgi:hypothetical protein
LNTVEFAAIKKPLLFLLFYSDPNKGVCMKKKEAEKVLMVNDQFQC